MFERHVTEAIEHQIAAHLRHIPMLGMPDLSLQCETGVVPQDSGRDHGQKTPASKSQTSITLAFRIGQPEIRMPQALSEVFEAVRPGKRDHRDLPVQRSDFVIELPQLRDVLQAVESTEVAQQNQDCRTPEQSARMEHLAADSQEIKVEIDGHVPITPASIPLR